MTRIKIIVHCLVKNEECFIWYALKSVLPFVDKIMVWDTGSTDDTLQIIKAIKSDKIEFKQITPPCHPEPSPVIPSEAIAESRDPSQKYSLPVNKLITLLYDYQLKGIPPLEDSVGMTKGRRLGRNDKEKKFTAIQHTKLRQQMLDQTPKGFTWLMILDGDEVWPKSQLKKIINYLKTTKNKAIVIKTRNLVGDIYHQLPESAGKYKIAGFEGNLGLRFINLGLPNLDIKNPHGGQTYTSANVPLQNLKKGLKVLPDTYYFHTTHLPRSSQDKNTLKRKFKRKFEIGESVNKKDLPKIFFTDRPEFVPDVTKPMSKLVYFKSLIQTPLRKFKRTIFPAKSGY